MTDNTPDILIPRSAREVAAVEKYCAELNAGGSKDPEEILLKKEAMYERRHIADMPCPHAKSHGQELRNEEDWKEYQGGGEY